MKRLLLPLQLEVDVADHEAQADGLQPVELGQHARPRLLEVPGRQHLELGPEAGGPLPPHVVVGAAAHGGRPVALTI